MPIAALTLITSILILATIGETIIEALKPALAPINAKLPIDLYLYLSLALGILLAVSYKADLLALIGLGEGLPYVGTILTGLLIGRGSNFVHDVISRVQPTDPPAAAIEPLPEETN